ncbi:65-kDa microtubule-associated protein 8 [Quillaja saponaria]|uniref:65-kDa microtubule-associated protein 8 n=1 Tax=Quillaja saponaria TaxID=32244 RepID=A0AAD7PJZ8_QUISA|nr:65-kDa microtubule-associated protein 8 [Quillaja saponaria]
MSSVQTPIGMRSSALLETSCGFLLQELQMIWDEVGEDQFEREKVLLDLEQESSAEAEAEFTHLLLSLGERSLPGRPEKMAGTLKEQLDSITPALKEMRLRKEERVNQFRSVQEQIQKNSAEIAGQSDDSSSSITVNENDLSLKKLEEYQIELQRLYNEKNERLHRVEKYIETVHYLSLILGMDSSVIIAEVHPSLNEFCGISKKISDSILDKLKSTVETLVQEKKKRLEKLHQLGKALTNLWDLMDASYDDRPLFSHVTNLLSVSSAEVSKPGSLTIDIIQQAEAEMENIIHLINSGEIDHADLLMSMDEQISKAKDEACSRKAIMEKVEKWMSARNEERWLEEYSMDENRYSVSRGAHKNLRRAERARITVSKIPALVDLLIAKAKSWEEERQKIFLYDEVSLLAMLEEYNMLRQVKEGEKQRQREKKKVQSQIVVGQENTYGSRPGTSCRRFSNGGLSNATPLNRRLSLSIQQLGLNSINSATQGISFIKEERKAQGQKIFARPSLVSHIRDQTASVMSTFSGPSSP